MGPICVPGPEDEVAVCGFEIPSEEVVVIVVIVVLMGGLLEDEIGSALWRVVALVCVAIYD